MYGVVELLAAVCDPGETPQGVNEDRLSIDRGRERYCLLPGRLGGMEVPEALLDI